MKPLTVYQLIELLAREDPTKIVVYHNQEWGKCFFTEVLISDNKEETTLEWNSYLHYKKG